MVGWTDETLSWENHHGSGRLHVHKMYHLPEQREENKPPSSGAQGLLCFFMEFFILSDSQAATMVLPTAHLNSIRLRLHVSALESQSSQSWAATHSICSSRWMEPELHMGRQSRLALAGTVVTWEVQPHCISTEGKKKLYYFSQASYFTHLLCKCS